MKYLLLVISILLGSVGISQDTLNYDRISTLKHGEVSKDISGRVVFSDDKLYHDAIPFEVISKRKSNGNIVYTTLSPDSKKCLFIYSPNYMSCSIAMNWNEKDNKYEFTLMYWSTKMLE